MQNFEFLRCETSGKWAINIAIQKYINFTHFCQELHENFQFDSHDKIFYCSLYTFEVADLKKEKTSIKIALGKY